MKFLESNSQIIIFRIKYFGKNKYEYTRPIKYWNPLWLVFERDAVNFKKLGLKSVKMRFNF